MKSSEFVILKVCHRAGEVEMQNIELKRVPATAKFSELALSHLALQHLRELIAQVRDRKPGGPCCSTVRIEPQK